MDKCLCACDNSTVKNFNRIFFKNEFYDFEIREDKYHVFPEESIRQVLPMVFDEEQFFRYFKDMSTIIDEKINQIFE